MGALSIARRLSPSPPPLGYADRVQGHRAIPAARSLLTAVAIVLVLCSEAPETALARSDGPGRIYRLGLLILTAASVKMTHSITLPELAKRGVVEGRNVLVDVRVGRAEAQPGLARELLAARSDVIDAIGSGAARATGEATSTVLIVMMATDPVAQGHTASLAHPGSNVTGDVILELAIDGNRRYLFNEGVPHTGRMTALLLSRSPARAAIEREMRVVAARAGLELLLIDAAGSADYPAAFADMRAGGAQALAAVATARCCADAETLAARTRSGSTDRRRMGRDGAGRLSSRPRPEPPQPELPTRRLHRPALHGAAAGDLPIEGPPAFESAFNINTARALGIAVPRTLVAGADEVVE